MPQPTKSYSSHDTHNTLPGTIIVFYCSSVVYLAAQVEQLGLSASLKSTIVVEAISSFTFLLFLFCSWNLTFPGFKVV